MLQHGTLYRTSSYLALFHNHRSVRLRSTFVACVTWHADSMYVCSVILSRLLQKYTCFNDYICVLTRNIDDSTVSV